MLTGKLSDTTQAEQLFPAMKAAFAWLREHAASIHNGTDQRIILAEGMWANVESPTMKPQDKQVLEVHREYIDIHVPVDKDETIGWRPTHLLNNELIPYSTEKDIAFYNDEPIAYITLHPGEYAIMTPLDAHAPIIGNGTVKKICVKIKV